MRFCQTELALALDRVRSSQKFTKESMRKQKIIPLAMMLTSTCSRLQETH